MNYTLGGEFYSRSIASQFKIKQVFAKTTMTIVLQYMNVSNQHAVQKQNKELEQKSQTTKTLEWGRGAGLRNWEKDRDTDYIGLNDINRMYNF